MSDGAGEPREPPGDSAGQISAGRVGRPHGLDGSFYVTGARARLLTLGTAVTVSGRVLEVVRRAGTDARPIVRLEEIEGRSGAEALRGLELTVNAGEAPALAEGEWWAHELEGCVVLDGDERVGVVIRLLELPSCEVLEVAPEHGGSLLLVPMVKDAVRRVEPSQRRIEVDLEFLGLAGSDVPRADPVDHGGSR